MSNRNLKILDKIRFFWEKNEKRFILGAGIILVAIISFEVGFLYGGKFENKTMVIEKTPYETNLPLVEKVLGAEEVAGVNLDESNKVNDKKECVFVGSKNSDKYHKPTCQWAKRIKAENAVCFSSEEDAQNKGYKPDSCVNK